MKKSYFLSAILTTLSLHVFTIQLWAQSTEKGNITLKTITITNGKEQIEEKILPFVKGGDVAQALRQMGADAEVIGDISTMDDLGEFIKVVVTEETQGNSTTKKVEIEAVGAPQTPKIDESKIKVEVEKPQQNQWVRPLNNPANTTPKIGVLLNPAYDKTTGEGVLIDEVLPESAAQKAGLQMGDILLQLNDTPIDSHEKLVTTVATYKVGDIVKLTYKRGTERLTTNLTLTAAQRPSWHEKDKAMKMGDSPCGVFSDCAHRMFSLNSDSAATPRLGLGIIARPNDQPQGMRILNVYPESAAQKAGLQTDDVITAIGNQKTTTLPELLDALKKYTEKDPISIQYHRNSQQQIATAQLLPLKRQACVKKIVKTLDNVGNEIEMLDENVEKILQDADINLDEILQKMQNLNIDVDTKDAEIKIRINGDRKVTITDASPDDIAKITPSHTNKTTPIQEAHSITNLNFYPNPNQGIFDLSFQVDKMANLSLAIFDMNGKAVFEDNRSNFLGEYNQKINITDHAKGSYFLRIIANQNALYKKIMVQ